MSFDIDTFEDTVYLMKLLALNERHAFPQSLRVSLTIYQCSWKLHTAVLTSHNTGLGTRTKYRVYLLLSAGTHAAD